MRWLNAFGTLLIPNPLRRVHKLGDGARSFGRPVIGTQGSIEIGAGFRLGSRPARSHIVALRGARVRIGDNVAIAYGAAITAVSSIEIGSGVHVGPFVVIMDSDFHRVGKRDDSGEVAPVVIGNNVRIGTRVTILRGTHIGDNVSILSGSTVQGVVRAGTTIAGVPAKRLVANRP